MSTVFLSQGFNGDISKLTPSGRKERIETLINTAEVTENFRKEVQTVKDEFTRNSIDILSSVNYDNGILSQLKNENLTLEQLISEMSKDEKYDKSIDEINKEKDEAEQMLQVLKFNEEQVRNRLQDLRDKKYKLETDNKMENSLIIEKSREIEKLKVSDVCPTCGRKLDGINEEHLQNSIKELENQINASKEKLKQNNEEILEINDKYSKSEQMFNSTVSERTNIEQKVSSYNKELIERSKSKDTSEQEKRLNENKIKIQDLSTKIEQNKEKYDKELELSEVANHCTVLINKQFRNYLLKTAVDYLNERLKHYSKLLFSNENDIIYFVQDASKLDIMLGDADFKTLSGGEKKKVCISLILAQKDLATRMSGLNSNILILDEVFENLDSEAIDVVIDALMQVSTDVDSMFIISHKETSIGYDSIITVTKEKDRISHITDSYS